jgi:hypothetical protein
MGEFEHWFEVMVSRQIWEVEAAVEFSGTG